MSFGLSIGDFLAVLELGDEFGPVLLVAAEDVLDGDTEFGDKASNSSGQAVKDVVGNLDGVAVKDVADPDGRVDADQVPVAALSVPAVENVVANTDVVVIDGIFDHD